MNSRHERDALGERDLPAEALHGIHTLRAVENFGLLGRPLHPGLVRALGAVKLAAARTNHALGWLPADIADAVERACEELADGTLVPAVIVDALQGGAGTSANMNVNEVLANRALDLLGAPRGDYARVSPTSHLNLHQSTNDVFPTALVPIFGYGRVGDLVAEARRSGRAIRDVAVNDGYVTAAAFDQATGPEAVCRLGFTRRMAEGGSPASRPTPPAFWSCICNPLPVPFVSTSVSSAAATSASRRS